MNKRSLRNSNGGEGEGEDRISNLTDDLLHRIMSFLNTKYAVQTCVLSKRWIPLWKSLPYLNFDYSSFPFQGSTIEGERVRNRGRENLRTRYFAKFINLVLERRRPSKLVKVCLSSSNCSLLDHVTANSLLCYAAAYEVEELVVASSETIMLSDSVTTLGMPALKLLHLVGLIVNKNLDPLIFSACPNLETLKLASIILPQRKILRIHYLHLKNLEIYHPNAGDFPFRCTVEIHAPKLTTFKYVGDPIIFQTVENLASLDEVHLDIRCGNVFEEENASSLIDIVKEFRHTKSLTIALRMIKFLSEFPALVDEHQLFYTNLRCLYLKCDKQFENFMTPPTLLNRFLSSSTSLKLCW